MVSALIEGAELIERVVSDDSGVSYFWVIYFN